jgi:hypothetical protein
VSGSRRFGVFVLASVSALFAVGTALADSAPETTTHTIVVGDDTEAWYQSLPVSICGTPIGCPPPLPIPVPGPSTIYPEGTLHVGVALGIELSRTYLRPGLFSLPADATLTAGTARIPIDPDLQAGTINPGAAAVRACLVTAPVTDGIQGALEDPPLSNCNVSSKVVTTPKGDALTIDLAPFIQAWRAGKPNFGFVLLPTPGGLSIWQLALNGQTAAGRHISYRLTYTQPATEPETPASTPPVTAAPPVEPTPVVIPPAVTTTMPPVAPPVIAQPQRPVAQVTTGFKYSAVFLVPLAFLFGLLFLGRTFTRDATPIDAAAGAAKRRH